MVEDAGATAVRGSMESPRARSTSARSRSGSRSRETTSSTCSVSPRSTPGPAMSTSDAVASGTRTSRSSAMAPSCSPNVGRPATRARPAGSRSRRRRCGTAHAATSARCASSSRPRRRPRASDGSVATTSSSTTRSPSQADIADDETVVERAPGGFTEYLGLDATRSPLDDVRIRRAIAHAIDRTAPALGQERGCTAATTGGLLPPAMPGHSHRVAPPFDPDRARALLVEAGHPEGRRVGEIVLAHWGTTGTT